MDRYHPRRKKRGEVSNICIIRSAVFRRNVTAHTKHSRKYRNIHPRTSHDIFELRTASRTGGTGWLNACLVYEQPVRSCDWIKLNRYQYVYA